MYHTTFKVILLIAVFFVSCEPERKHKKEEKKEKKIKTTNYNKPLNKANVVSVLSEYGKENKENRILIKTSMGDISIKLYENTPIHRANFIRLIKNNFYENTVFYRVIKDFMIQGGGTDDIGFRKKMRAMGSYRLPSEFKKENIHKSGSLSMARRYENNPEKESVSFDFFLVDGKKYTKPELDALAKENKVEFNSNQMKVYTTIGGAPHLDGEHTVFGEVEKGMEVIKKIAEVETDKGDWPLEDIKVLNIEIIK